MDVDVLVYDGFDELDAIGPYEVFAYATRYAAEANSDYAAEADSDYAAEDGAGTSSDPTEDSDRAAGSGRTECSDRTANAGHEDGFAGRVRYVTLTERDVVTASHGTRIGIDGILPEPSDDDAPDLLVVPGGGWSARDEEASAWAEARKGAIPDALASYHDAGVRIATVCTGAMLLAESGVLEGRRAVTHASAIDDLRNSGARVVDARIVDDGDVLTAGGITSGIDLALSVVEEEFGAAVVDRVATVLEYERRD